LKDTFGSSPFTSIIVIFEYIFVFDESKARIQRCCTFPPYKSNSVRRYSKEEPFSVISVDIRNHSTLLDSLEQYVKGELLEGADAYHCEKCNKKVRINQ
jgi:ubiquitin C-terminal hydrolase